MRIYNELLYRNRQDYSTTSVSGRSVCSIPRSFIPITLNNLLSLKASFASETTTMELDAFIAKVTAEIRNRSL